MAFLVAGLTLLLPGCGFQMRGDWELPSSLQNTVMSGGGQALYTYLQREFRAASASLERPPVEGAARLIVSQNTMNKRVLSVDNRGKVIEYEIYYLLKFKILGADGNLIVKEQQINMTRDYPFVATQVIGASHEEALLRDNMYKDMARQIMRRIQAQTG
jgi:LPS-assembly lipoprotein